jgi:hypothetical protein
MESSQEQTPIDHHIGSFEVGSLGDDGYHPIWGASFDKLHLGPSIVKSLGTEGAVPKDGATKGGGSILIQGIDFSEGDETLWITVTRREADLVIAPNKELPYRTLALENCENTKPLPGRTPCDRNELQRVAECCTPSPWHSSWPLRRLKSNTKHQYTANTPSPHIPERN